MPDVIAYVSSSVILVASVLAWEFGPGLRQRSRRALLLGAVGLTLSGLFAYLSFYSSYVIAIDDERIIIGYESNPQTLAVYNEKCPDLGEIELERASNDPALLFTKESLIHIRLGLVAAWLVFVAGFMAAVSWAVAGKRRAVAPAKS